MFTKGRREDTEFGEGSDTAQGITPTHHQFAVANHRGGCLRFRLPNSSFLIRTSFFLLLLPRRSEKVAKAASLPSRSSISRRLVIGKVSPFARRLE